MQSVRSRFVPMLLVLFLATASRAQTSAQIAQDVPFDPGQVQFEDPVGFDLPSGGLDVEIFPAPVPGVVDVGSTLRVRAYPWGPVLGALPHGSSVSVLGIVGDFYLIAYEGGVACVHRHYVATEGAPARQHPLEYPPGCRAGGHVSVAELPDFLTAAGAGKSGGGGDPSGSGPAQASNPLPGSVADARTVGRPQGDGTPAGAVAWGLDQLAGGTRNGVNSNNGKSSKNIDAWNNWCLAFVATAYGRKISDLAASSAYNAYKKCRASGRSFQKGGAPPMGAVFFTGPTSGNPYGHVFMATGETSPDGQPYVLTNTGYGGLKGIQRITLGRMLSMVGGEYLGWTPMP